MLKGKTKKTAAEVTTKEVKKRGAKKGASTSGTAKLKKKAVQQKEEAKQAAGKPKKEKSKQPSPRATKQIAEKEKVQKSTKEEVLPDPADRKPEDNRPSLRAVYSNKSYTLLPLGFATDFATKTDMVIFSNLSTGAVHTTALSVWKRWKLKEVKKINTET